MEGRPGAYLKVKGERDSTALENRPKGLLKGRGDRQTSTDPHTPLLLLNTYAPG